MSKAIVSVDRERERERREGKKADPEKIVVTIILVQ
jgi:hypothetical protein